MKQKSKIVELKDFGQKLKMVELLVSMVNNLKCNRCGFMKNMLLDGVCQDCISCEPKCVVTLTFTIKEKKQ